MTKEKKTTSTKKTSKAKLVKVEEKPFDLIIDFGPAHENEDRKEIELAEEIAYREKKRSLFKNLWILKPTKAPWYKRLGLKRSKQWFNR